MCEINVKNLYRVHVKIDCDPTIYSLSIAVLFYILYYKICELAGILGRASLCLHHPDSVGEESKNATK